jgi:hypothetical protein
MSYQTLRNPLKNLSFGGFCRRSLKGAEVFYTAGAQVSRVELPTDFSAIQISGLQATCNAQTIQELLSDLGFTVTIQDVQIRAFEKDIFVANVKVKDPYFSKQVVTKFSSMMKNGVEGTYRIKEMQFSNTQGTISTNRLQKSAVTCSWSKASCVAWLHYNSEKRAREAERILAKKGIILGRKVECNLQIPIRISHKTKFSVQVGNLDRRTQRKHFNALLDGANRPDTIVFGKPSHPYSDQEAEKMVKDLLMKEGLESWESIPASGTFRAKATARFPNTDMASQAVQKLHNTKLVALANSRLFLSHITSVKFSIPEEMFQVLLNDIVYLQAQLKRSGHTHLRSYPPTQALSPYIVLKVSGEDFKAVAEVKSAIERLISGTAAEGNEGPLWDAYFTTAPGLAYLRDLHQRHQVYIHRDVRRRRLALYGSDLSIQTVQEALIDKVKALSELKHTIVLDSVLLQKALSGGWRAIVDEFGKEAATLDIVHRPMTITIRGSQVDLQNAQALLVMKHNDTNSPESKHGEQVCIVCLDEAVEPFKTSCQHTYCSECFVSQCVAAGDEEVQICCYGDEARCKYVFPNMVLEKVLPAANFEMLLNVSFTTYIRMHPKDFQYCPTPDCMQIYRVSTNGITFDCPQCLAAICTSCGVISHDGMTCAAYKELSSDGTKALNEWKKENDVRDCPECETHIMKSYGCNHMECGGCRTHICWFCMQTFDSSQACYGHMTTNHGSFYAAGEGYLG